MFINPNTEIPLCFTYILGTTVTIAFVNHVGFVDVFLVSQITSRIHFVPSKIVQFVYKFETCFLVSFAKRYPDGDSSSLFE